MIKAIAHKYDPIKHNFNANIIFVRLPLLNHGPGPGRCTDLYYNIFNHISKLNNVIVHDKHRENMY